MPVKVRKQRLRLLKFRDLDTRARAALRSMLERLPSSAPEDGPDRVAGISLDAVLDEIARSVSSAGLLASSAYYAAHSTDSGEVLLVLARLGEGQEQGAQPSERPLGSVRRLGPAVFELRPAPSSFSRASRPHR
jgi:hypothetical protein